MVNIPTGMNIQALMIIARTKSVATLLRCLTIVKDECKKAVPIDTGELRESIRIEPPKWITPFIVEGKVLAGGPDAPQAYYTEHGTPDHGTVFSQAMHFNWKGSEIFAKSVRGITPMNWMRNSIMFALPRIQGEMGLLAKELLGTYTLTVNIKGA